MNSNSQQKKDFTYYKQKNYKKQKPTNRKTIIIQIAINKLIDCTLCDAIQLYILLITLL
jgi:hypothetical protein